ncbi:MAG: hypothetical protein NWE93_14775 [Candidatus Bathyarchaeota archaeon]|nr:hypothetical protein [Candidatus Bathyarchaeota archaeon]
MKLSHRALGVTALASGIMAFCLLVLPYMLFPQFYVPKTSGVGYTAPATIEGLVLMAAGLVLLVVSVIFAQLYRHR